MAKDPAFLFYTNDFQSGTLFFTDEQVGKYIRLLMAQHQHGHLTEKQVLFICKSHDEDILNKFTKDKSGLYFNSKLDEVIEARSKFSESRRNNRLGKTKPQNKPVKKNNTSLTYDIHMENENENENIDINNNKSFETFWNLYAKSVDKQKCIKKWEKIPLSLHDTIFAHIKQYVASTPDKQFRRNPETYLNNKGWESEIVQPIKPQKETSLIDAPDEF